jgi:hypothetical protein
MTSDRKKLSLVTAKPRSVPWAFYPDFIYYQVTVGSRQYALHGLGSRHVREASIDGRAGLLLCLPRRAAARPLAAGSDYSWTGACDN